MTGLDGCAAAEGEEGEGDCGLGVGVGVGSVLGRLCGEAGWTGVVAPERTIGVEGTVLPGVGR